MQILIEKALMFLFFYILYESLILCKHVHILLSLKFKENTIFKRLLSTHYRNTYQRVNTLLQT